MARTRLSAKRLLHRRTRWIDQVFVFPATQYLFLVILSDVRRQPKKSKDLLLAEATTAVEDFTLVS